MLQLYIYSCLPPQNGLNIMLLQERSPFTFAFVIKEVKRDKDKALLMSEVYGATAQMLCSFDKLMSLNKAFLCLD